MASQSLVTRERVHFAVNGKIIVAQGPAIFLTLAEFLRKEQRLIGTKIVCAEGDCGACSVLYSRGIDFVPVNSCIMIVGQLDGCHIVTIDGIREAGSELHPVQDELVKCHASQCGFCTPGFVVTICGMLEKGVSTSTEKSAQNHLTGNLCRCTGYQPILEAAVSASKRMKLEKTRSLKSRFLTAKIKRDLVQATRTTLSVSLNVGGVTRTFSAPKSLLEWLKQRRLYPKATILGAGTDLGVAFNKGKQEPTFIASMHALQGKGALAHLRSVQIKRDKAQKGQALLEVGANVTLTELRHALIEISESKAYLKKFNVKEIIGYLDLFASPQIKNVATLVGNIANASPIGDMPPLLMVLNGNVRVMSNQGESSLRVIPLNRFFIGYRKTALNPGDTIVSVSFELPTWDEKIEFRKISQRKDLDISAVNASFRVLDSGRVLIALGGVADRPIRLSRTERLLEKTFADKPAVLDQAIWQKISKTLQAEIRPMTDLRGSETYRRVLIDRLFKSFLQKRLFLSQSQSRALADDD